MITIIDIVLFLVHFELLNTVLRRAGDGVLKAGVNREIGLRPKVRMSKNAMPEVKERLVYVNLTTGCLPPPNRYGYTEFARDGKSSLCCLEYDSKFLGRSF